MTRRHKLLALSAGLLFVPLPHLGMLVAPRCPAPPEIDVRICVEREALPPGGVAHLGSLNGSLWPPGKMLRVKFLEGGPLARRYTLAAMKAWERHANVRFVASADDDAEVRVRFRAGQGSWAYIGRGALQVPLNQHTMNLGWLNERSDPSEFYVATHEAGHVLGFVHGQNLPNAAIPWDEAKVYAFFAGPPNYWDRATILSNVLHKFAPSEVQAGPFDRDSIMQYPVDAKLTTNGFSIGWNRVISPGDSAFARRAYPFPSDAGSGVKCPDPRSFLVPEGVNL